MPGKKAPIKTKFSEIWLEQSGLLCLKFNDNVEADLEEVQRAFKVYEDLGLGPNKKVLQLMFGQNNFTITPEARAYAAKKGNDFFIASAMISNNLAVRMLVNFFNKFDNNQVPFKMFGTEAEAREWLGKFKK